MEASTSNASKRRGAFSAVAFRPGAKYLLFPLSATDAPPVRKRAIGPGPWTYGDAELIKRLRGHRGFCLKREDNGLKLSKWAGCKIQSYCASPSLCIENSSMTLLKCEDPSAAIHSVRLECYMSKVTLEEGSL